MALGTLVTLDTLRSNLQTVVQIGEDKTFAAIDAARQVHNQFVRDMTSSLVEITVDRKRRFGGPASMTMRKVDQLGVTRSQKVIAGQDVDFPLELSQVAVQWSAKYLKVATGKEFAEQFIATQDADVKQVLADLKTALFGGGPAGVGNYSVNDILIDNVLLNVKVLINSDGTAMPIGPNGEVFVGSTHNHYIGSGTIWTSATAANIQADMDALVEHVIEHYLGGGSIKIYINRAQETKVRSVTGISGNTFQAYLPAQIVRGTATDHAEGILSMDNLYDRAIGIYNGAEVCVKPWIPAGYLLCFREGTEKPLVLRERMQSSFGLTILAEYDDYPLRAKALENEYGVGVWNRTAAAVLDTLHTTYAAPTIVP